MPWAGSKRCRKLNSSAESCSAPCTRMTIGTLRLPGGSSSRPTNVTPPLLKLVSATLSGIRLPRAPAKSMPPIAQSEKMTFFPSGRPVHPNVLRQLPSGCRANAPVSPSTMRQRRVDGSEGAMSMIRPSLSRYAPTWQSSAAIAAVAQPASDSPIASSRKKRGFNLGSDISPN